MHTCRNSSRALELLVSRFIVGKRRQTAGSCKQSCIWERKALLSAPWPVTALQGILFGLCTSAHHPTPPVLYAWALASPPAPRGQTDCWANPQGLAPMHETSLGSSEQVTKSCICLQASRSDTVVRSLLMSIYFLVFSFSLASSVTFLHPSQNGYICTFYSIIFKDLFRLCWMSDCLLYVSQKTVSTLSCWNQVLCWKTEIPEHIPAPWSASRLCFTFLLSRHPLAPQRFFRR